MHEYSPDTYFGVGVLAAIVTFLMLAVVVACVVFIVKLLKAGKKGWATTLMLVAFIIFIFMTVAGSVAITTFGMALK